MRKRKSFPPGLLVLLFLLLRPGALPAEILLAGAVYYDSYPSFREAQDLLATRDTQGLGEMIKYSHVSDPLPAEHDIKVIRMPDLGQGPNAPVEFCFMDSQTTYWTMQKFVADQSSAKPSPTSKSTAAPEFVPGSSPSPLPATTPTPVPKPNPEPTPTPLPATKKEEPAAPFDDRGGTIRWHKVNGVWKWYPLDPSKFKGVKPKSKAKDNDVQPDGSRRLIPPE